MAWGKGQLATVILLRRIWGRPLPGGSALRPGLRAAIGRPLVLFGLLRYATQSTRELDCLSTATKLIRVVRFR